jgi:hypothetical protein
MKAYFACIVDLREARQLGRRQCAHHADHAEMNVFRCERMEECLVRRRVLGPDRTQDQRPEWAVDMPLECL